MTLSKPMLFRQFGQGCQTSVGGQVVSITKIVVVLIGCCYFALVLFPSQSEAADLSFGQDIDCVSVRAGHGLYVEGIVPIILSSPESDEITFGINLTEEFKHRILSCFEPISDEVGFDADGKRGERSEDKKTGTQEWTGTEDVAEKVCHDALSDYSVFDFVGLLIIACVLPFLAGYITAPLFAYYFKW